MRTSAQTEAVLDRENETYRGTGGVSAGNARQGFRPAFMDRDTGHIFLPRHADGRLAPCHLLDGLPPELTERDGGGRVRAAKASLCSGFVLGELFYSREEAARLVAAG